jgi:multidrug efflux system outer membrane protein
MRARRLAALSPLALLGACSLAPAYHPPQTAAPVAFKEEAAPIPAGWTQATPLDATHRGEWWTAFNDPVLDDLETRAVAASPTLAAALARYDEARANAQVDASGLFPMIGAQGQISHERVSGNAQGGTGVAENVSPALIEGSLNYEIDLWGRIRNTVAASRAEAAATDEDLVSARLSLQADVADAYVRLRGLDAQAALLASTVQAYERAYQLTIDRHSGGVASGLDVNRARTTLSDARAQVFAVANQRAATEHELAALVGALASDFSVAPRTQALDAPEIPAGVPSQLLQRRPDIAAAERRMFEANAKIGVARAAFFPAITVGASAGFDSTHASSLFDVPSSFWGLGPFTAALALFDGGRRSAQVKLSRAQYDEMAANYRNTVLTAFQQVEDGIAAMHHLAGETVEQRDAADAAQRTSDLALTRYRDGASDYLEVVTAQTAALSAQQNLLTAQVDRMRASISLVKALGGEA